MTLINDINENELYLTEQLITYFGNKRKLLNFIKIPVEEICIELATDKLIVADLFSGSGIVARFLKAYSSTIYANDLEGYSRVINECYLTNKKDVNWEEVVDEFLFMQNKLKNDSSLKADFITKLYAPENDDDIKEGERVFYTNRNARFLDTARKLIDTLPEENRKYFIAPLLSEASIKANNAASFKGFYTNSETKRGQFGGNGSNALQRIKADINLLLPILSNYNCNSKVFQMDANELAKELKGLDLVYLDPPYNQHPYSSNYHMLNTINDYIEPKEISPKVGIPTNWNKSNYNKKELALKSLSDLVSNLDTKYVLISFNSDGFISKEEMEKMLSEFGEVKTFAQEYSVFRGGKNLNQRKSGIKVNEYLYKLKKG